MPKNETDINKTAQKLERHDNQLKFGILAGAAATVFLKRPGKFIGLFTAYHAGTRQLVQNNHQQALEANRDLLGNLPVNPYPGFFGSSEESQQATKVISELSKAAVKAYEDTGAKKQVDDFIENVSGPK